MIGMQLGPYQIVAKLGEGGPPPRLRRGMWELRRDLAEALQRPLRSSGGIRSEGGRAEARRSAQA